MFVFNNIASENAINGMIKFTNKKPSDNANSFFIDVYFLNILYPSNAVKNK